MTEQVLLGMMVSRGNIGQARATADAFAIAIGRRAVLAVQTDDLDRHADPLRAFLGAQSGRWKRVWLWDTQCDDAWQWDAALPRPFYVGENIFSHGGAFNRLLALALVVDEPLLVRVDAGTAPLDALTFGASLDAHVAYLRRHDVISGRYDKRIALRDDFLDDADRPAFHELVRRHVGVDPLNQITGGACFALRVDEGPPAIAFPGFLPVWGSDDAFFQSGASRVLVNAEMVVARRAPGQPLTGPEYPARLGCAAALAALHRRAHLSPRLIRTFDAVVAAGTALLDELRSSFPDAVKASDHGEAQRRLRERAPGLIEGYENYIGLRHRWGEVRGRILEMAPTLLERCRLTFPADAVP
jgi:hypothetical protein